MKTFLIILLGLAVVLLTPTGWTQQNVTPAEDEVEIQLPGNSIHEVLSLYEMLTGRRLIKDATLAGNLSIIVPGKIPRSDAISILESAMLLNGYSLVPIDGKTTKVLGAGKSPLGEGIPLYADSSALPDKDQIVSYFMLLRYISTKDALAVFQAYIAMRPQGGSMVAVPNSNAIVITENTPLVRRLVALQQLIDVPNARTLTEFIPLERADAERVAEIINKLLDQEKKEDAQAIADTATAPPPAPAPPGAAAPAPSGSGGANSTLTQTATPTMVIADPRTNRILLVASEGRMPYVRQLVLDLDEAVNLEEPLERPLKFIPAGEALPVLQSILAEGDVDAESPSGASAAGSQTGSPQVNDSSGSSFGSSGGFGDSGGGKPDKLLAPQESTAPLAVSVGKARIIADRSSNTIIVIGPPEAKNKAARVLDMIDKRPKQVYLATVIGQLTLGDGIEAGIDYLVKFKGTGGNNQTGIGSLLRTRSAGTDLLPDPTQLLTNAALPLASGLTIYGTIAESVDIYAKALATTNKFRIISRPVVYTANNKKAVISSGQSVPIPENTLTSAVSTSNVNPNNTGTAIASSIQYKPVVLKLEVIPLINSNDEVTLTIAQQNDTIQQNVIVSNNEVPVIGTQELTTTITVKNRDTIVLGGLITEEQQRSQSGIPFFSSVPGLGYLFSTTKKTTTRRELIILIQPMIINTPEDLSEANYVEKSMSTMKDELYDDKMTVRKALPASTPKRAFMRPIPRNELPPMDQ